MKRFCILTIVLFIFPFKAHGQLIGSLADIEQDAIYVWRDPDPGRNGTPIDLVEAQRLADFAVAEGISTIYYDNFGCGALSLPNCPDGAEAQDPSTLALIISLLHNHGLRVEALYTDNIHIPDVVSYNNTVSADARFDAIRLNIESFPRGGSEVVADWIMSLQYTDVSLPSDGAIKIHHDPGYFAPNGDVYFRVVPYFSNLAVVGCFKRP